MGLLYSRAILWMEPRHRNSLLTSDPDRYVHSANNINIDWMTTSFIPPVAQYISYPMCTTQLRVAVLFINKFNSDG